MLATRGASAGTAGGALVQLVTHSAMAGRPAEVVGSCVEVSLKASGLTNMDYFSLSDPFVVLSTRSPATPGTHPPPTDVVLCQTETCWDNLDPVFVKRTTLGADTLCDLPLIVTIYDRDSKKEQLAKHDLLGEATSTLRAVLDGGVDGLTLPLRLPADGPSATNVASHGSVTLMADTFNATATTHNLTFDVEPLAPRLAGGKPYVVVSQRRGDNSWHPIHRTAMTSSARKFSLRRRLQEGDPTALDPAAAPSTAILRTYRGRGRLTETPLRFELWAHEKTKPHRLMGTAQLSLGSLRRQLPGKHLVLSHMGVVAAELVFRSVDVQAADASTFGLVISMAA